MYKHTKENQSVIRKADGACIPFAEGNADYAVYQQYVTDGGIVDPYVAPDPTPDELDYIDTKTDNRVVTFAGKTKAQVKVMADNIVTLDDAKDVIKTLLIIVRILAKRL